ncbi:MAG TPA: hypothetical protein VMG12_27025, partial [Polyangiaceae bacterium]|nr:hypothetical protein [Polyangiaceae bacterium]
MTHVPTQWISTLALCAATAALAGACGDSDDSTQVAPPGAEPSMPSEPSEPANPVEPDPAPTDPALMVMSRVCAPEGCNHYMYFLRELPSDGVLDRSQGLELGDTQAAVFDGKGYVFDRLNGSVTRWTVDADLTPHAEQTISFQGTGITQLDAIANVFASPTHAYVLDSAAGVLVTWNPSAMQIVSSTTLPDAVLSRGDAPLFALWPVASGGRVYYSASWYDYDSRRGYEKAALLSFAADADAPDVAVLEDERCAITSSVAPFVDERGDVYFAGDWYTGVLQIGVTTGQAPTPACLLRVSGATGAVDPDFYVDLLQAADARAMTGAFYLGDGKWLMNVWPNSVPAPSAAELEANPDAYLGASNFEYVVIVDLQNGTRLPVSGLSRGGWGGLTPMYLDGLPLLQLFPSSGGAETGALLYQVKPT